MRIRNDQMEAFSESLEESFVKQTVAHLRDDLRAPRQRQGIAEGDIEPLVRRGMAEAKSYGVVYEGDVRRYLECKVLLGPAFDRDRTFAWAGEILRQEDIDGTVKMDRIDEYMLFGLEKPR